MLIGFSYLPIVVDTELKQFFGQTLEDHEPYSSDTVLTLYPELGNTALKVRYTVLFKCMKPDIFAMSAIITFELCDGFARLIGICRKTNSWLMDAHYHIDELPIEAFLNQWHLCISDEFERAEIKLNYPCKTLPLH